MEILKAFIDGLKIGIKGTTLLMMGIYLTVEGFNELKK